MPEVEESIDIRAPADQVFPAITDPRRTLEWNPNIVSVRDITPGPVDVGSSWRQTAMVVGREIDVLCTVVKWQSPHLGVLRITGDQSGQVTTRCESRDGLTHVVQVLEYETPRGITGGVFSLVAGNLLHREMSQSLQRMRDTVEREAAETDGSATA